MNREIKYRIWDNQNRRWITENGYSLHCNSNWAICPFTGMLTDYVGMDGEFGEVYIASPVPDYYMQDGEVTKEPRYILMQYTGLKDKNGKEIYECDIVEIGDRKKEVIFNMGMFYIDENYGDIVPLSEVDNIIEVVGSIFETPELLK